jgi:hypothetical protein
MSPSSSPRQVCPRPKFNRCLSCLIRGLRTTRVGSSSRHRNPVPHGQHVEDVSGGKRRLPSSGEMMSPLREGEASGAGDFLEQARCQADARGPRGIDFCLILAAICYLPSRPMSSAHHRYARLRPRSGTGAHIDSATAGFQTRSAMDNTLIRSRPCQCGAEMFWTQNAWAAHTNKEAAYRCTNGHVIDPATTRQCPGCGIHDTEVAGVVGGREQFRCLRCGNAFEYPR